jgi:hypothetical protein
MCLFSPTKLCSALIVRPNYYFSFHSEIDVTLASNIPGYVSVPFTEIACLHSRNKWDEVVDKAVSRRSVDRRDVKKRWWGEFTAWLAGMNLKFCDD